MIVLWLKVKATNDVFNAPMGGAAFTLFLNCVYFQFSLSIVMKHTTSTLSQWFYSMISLKELELDLNK